MRALVYHGPGNRCWEDAPDPVIIDDTDVIVRVEATTICGTDLHIVKGDLPAVADGRILGHEAVGTVVTAGPGTRRVAVGDRVLVSCVSSCGACRYCREGHAGQCLGGGGWILGNTIDGTHAEFVRVPFADLSTYPLPAGVADETLLMLADILPTSYEVGVLNGRVGPGDIVVVVGAGPIGLSAVIGARLFSPSIVVSIDQADIRLTAAKAFGADVTINNSREDPVDIVNSLTGGLGADVAIEAVGVPATFELATTLIRSGGHIANVGVHGKPATLHLENLWSRNVTITTGLVDAYSTPVLLRMIANGQLGDIGNLATHHFELDEFEHAYDVFGDAADTGALKVVLTAPRTSPRPVGRATDGPAEVELTGAVLNVLTNQAEVILDGGAQALQRSHEPHYAQAGPEASRERLARLLELVAASVENRDLVPMIDYATYVANERFDAGFDIREVQCAFHVLEEAIWERVVASVPQSELAASVGLVGTVLGAGRDALARTYVSRASQQHVPSLDLSALFRGGH